MTSIAQDAVDPATIRHTTITPFGMRIKFGYDDHRFAAASRRIAALPVVGPFGSVADPSVLSITARSLAGDDRADDAAGEPTDGGAPDPAWPETSVRQWKGGLELRCGSGRLTADLAAGTASIALPPSLLAIDDAVRCFVEGAIATLAMGTGRMHAVHSGLVVGRRKGLLLRGPSGAGKSTLGYACVRSGFRLVSDDWVYGAAGGTADRFAGYPWRLFLVAESAARFPELAGIAPVPHPGADRLKIPVHPPVHQRRRAADVDAVVFLDPDPALSLTRIGPAESLERFWGAALPSERAQLPPAWVDRLLDRPGYVLRRGTDPMAAAELLRQLAS